MSAKGCSHIQIARAIGLDAKTLRERLKDDPAAAEAFNAGKSEEEGVLVGLLRRKADQGDTVSAMFLLKSRHGYRDRGDTDTGSQSGVQVTISLPGPLPAEQYAKLIDAVPVDRPANALSSSVEAK
jgi:hypothetical protein